MAAVLHQSRYNFDGLSIVLLRSAYAEALAVEAPPSIKAAAAAGRFVHQGRLDGTLNSHGSLAMAFSGCAKPGRFVVNELREACVYIVSTELNESAVDNAQLFLADVEARMPEVMRIVGSAGLRLDHLPKETRSELELPEVDPPSKSINQVAPHRKT